MTADSMDSADYAEMAAKLHDEPGVEETVQMVLDYALRAVGCDFAGVTFVHGNSRIETVATTDALIDQLDHIQMDVGEGPDLEILANHESLMIDDVETDGRWPTWAAQVKGAGIRSLLNLRLNTPQTVVGTLNLYGRRPHQFDRDDEAVAHIIARHAAIALSAARNEMNLTLAMDARKVVGQAQGILIERYGLDPDKAFAVLRRYSQDHNIKLHRVAADLVQTGRLPDPKDHASSPGLEAGP